MAYVEVTTSKIPWHSLEHLSIPMAMFDFPPCFDSVSRAVKCSKSTPQRMVGTFPIPLALCRLTQLSAFLQVLRNWNAGDSDDFNIFNMAKRLQHGKSLKILKVMGSPKSFGIQSTKSVMRRPSLDAWKLAESHSFYGSLWYVYDMIWMYKGFRITLIWYRYLDGCQNFGRWPRLSSKIHWLWP